MKSHVLAFLLPAATLALTLPLPLRASAQGLPAAPRVLTMSGMGQVKAAPDTAEINAGVTTTAPTAAAALAANSSQMTAVFAAIKKLGVAEKDIRTLSFSVSPEYASGANNVPPRLTGYRVNNEVQIRLEDVGKLGTSLDALVTAGANHMNGISFGIKDSSLLLADARAKAVADARAKAETYAKAAGVTLGPILSISESGSEPPRPIVVARLAAPAFAPTPIAAGDQSVSANVSITWEIH